MEYKDYYAVLGIAKNASKEEVRRAYRKLARKFHPDVNKSADAQARFVEINEAYEVLKDPEKRDRYDQYGKYWSGADGQPPPGWGAGAGGETFSRSFHFGGGDFTSQGRDFSDFFKNLFGGGFAAGGQRPFEYQYARRGRTSEAELEVSLEDVYHGVTRTITLQTFEDETGQRHQRTLQVKIPRGVAGGSVMRLAGQGEKGAGGSPPGDLLLTVRIAPHPLFRVVGRDLHTTVALTPWEAALGGKVKVKTVEGEVNLSIPAGTQSGRRFRLKGKGLPRQSGGAGDIIVTVQIRVPHPLSAGEKKYFESLAEHSAFNPRRRKGGQKASDSEEI